MATSSNVEVPVLLRLRSGRAFLKSSLETVDVPVQCAQGSQLIVDLLEEAGGSDCEVPLPLSIVELKAWLAFSKSAVSKVDACPAGNDYKTAPLALKAANFLNDTATTAALAGPFLQAILSGDEEMFVRAIPSQEQCDRAAQIAGSVPPDCLPAVFAEVKRNQAEYPHDHPLSWLTPATKLGRLVKLLPPMFHTALVQAFCCSIEGGTSLTLPLMPSCSRTCPDPAHHDAESSDEEDEGGRRPSPCGPGCASVLFQVLAGAAPLAGGSFQLAWDPDCASDPLPDSPEPKSKRMCLRNDPCLEAATAWCHQLQNQSPLPDRAIIQLTLCLSDDNKADYGEDETEPPRWCIALAQFRTLRSLSVSAFDPDRLSAREFGAALRRLAALSSLSVSCCEEEGEGVFEVAAPHTAMTHLVSAVASLSQLSALTLLHCFYLGSNRTRDYAEPRALPEVAQLSQLTRLTALTFRASFSGPEGTGALVHAVKQMTLLQELGAGLHRAAGVSSDAGAELTSQLCCAVELTALRSLSLRVAHYERGGNRLPVSRLHRSILDRNAALLARLTALDLSETGTDMAHQPRPRHAGAVAALVAFTPGLRSLCLGGNALRDAGLVQLAAAPCMPHLTRLAIDESSASYTGVGAVLQSLVRGQAAGGEGLRELDVSFNDIASEHTVELARLLGQLSALQVLGMIHAYVRTTEEDLQELFGTFATMRQLRSLHLYGHCSDWLICPAGKGCHSLPTLRASLPHVAID